MELARFFEMGGWMMYPLVLLLALCLPASVGLPIAGYAIGKPKLAFLFAMILAVLGVAAAGLGALGQAMGMRMVEQAVVHVNPVDRDTILMVGSGEARVCLAFGLVVAMLPLAAACVALGRAFGQKLSSAATAGGLVAGLGVAIGMGALSARQFALIQVETAMGMASPDMRPALVAAGANEAVVYLTAALVAGLPLVLVGAVLLGLGARAAKAQAAG
ncbi:MAG TPA: hypothetical protein VGK67_22075 [Myxococcales bacterium]|jgi:hypothetical protein